MTGDASRNNPERPKKRSMTVMVEWEKNDMFPADIRNTMMQYSFFGDIKVTEVKEPKHVMVQEDGR